MPLGLNLGCGPIMLTKIDGIDFINIDHDKMYERYADDQKAVFYVHDLSKGLPSVWIENGMPIIYSERQIAFVNLSQFLEHLNLPAAEQLLSDCHYLMDSGATIRISVPDLELLLFHLRTNKMDTFQEQQPAKWYMRYNSQTMKFALLLFGSLHEDGESGHKMCYDFQSMKELLEKVGFAKVKRVKFDSRYDAEVGENHQLCVEAKKL